MRLAHQDTDAVGLRRGRLSSGVSSTDARLDLYVHVCESEEELDLDRTKGRQAE